MSRHPFWARAIITHSRCPAIPMVDAGILDGDTVLIRKVRGGGEWPDGVVALVDDLEVTLKRLRRRGNSTALGTVQSGGQTANPAGR